MPLSRITVCRPGGPSWTARKAAKPATDDAGKGAAALVTGQPVTAGGVSLGTGYILFVGTLEPRKNVGGLLQSYTQLVQRWPDAPRLVLAGRSVALSEPWLEALTKEPLASKAVHLGYVADSEREALYKGASVLVLPSFNEGFGLPVLEAMTVGVPVIASNRGALPEVLGDAGMLIDPDDPDSLTAALERMLTDTALARRLAARGLRRTRLFDWIASARALRTAYDEAVAFHAARPGHTMRIAVDARELAGKPTGVGRYLAELLACWSRDPAAARARDPAADARTAAPPRRPDRHGRRARRLARHPRQQPWRQPRRPPSSPVGAASAAGRGGQAGRRCAVLPGLFGPDLVAGAGGRVGPRRVVLGASRMVRRPRRPAPQTDDLGQRPPRPPRPHADGVLAR